MSCHLHQGASLVHYPLHHWYQHLAKGHGHFLETLDRLFQVDLGGLVLHVELVGKGHPPAELGRCVLLLLAQQSRVIGQASQHPGHTGPFQTQSLQVPGDGLKSGTVALEPLKKPDEGIVGIRIQ